VIGQGMQLYAAQNKGAIIGAGINSRHFFNTSSASWTVNTALVNPNPLPLTGPIAAADWIGPMMDIMNLKPAQSTIAAERYARYREVGTFICPAGRGINNSPYETGDFDAGVGQQLGYATAFSFLLMPKSIGGSSPGMTDHTRISGGPGWWDLPAGYSPKITRVGKAAEKIFAADAGKFSNGNIFPTYNLRFAPVTNAGASSSPYTDYGAFTMNTTAYDRGVANNDGSTFDGRLFSYRHGVKKAGQPTGSYRLNVVFYDGHAETMNEKDAMRPDYWLPTGTTLVDGSKIWPDVTAMWVDSYPYVIK
jgi:prepilin-type processing-associated H-X9-DG protein